MASIPNTDTIPLQFRGKQWILRKRFRSGKRFERGLGTANKAEAKRRALHILHEELHMEHLTGWQASVADGLTRKGWLRVMYSNGWNRKKKKGGNFTLADLEFIATRSGGYCEVSGLPFYLGEEKHHAFKPSLDRIDSNSGYDPWNLRMVLMTVNYCMSHWGEGVFLQISAAVLAKHLQKISQGWGLDGAKIPSKSNGKDHVTI